MAPTESVQKAIFVKIVPVYDDIYSRNILPKFGVDQIIFDVFIPTVEPRDTNSSIVLKLGKLCFTSKNKNGENVVKKPINKNKAILGIFLYSPLKINIIAEIGTNINAK